MKLTRSIPERTESFEVKWAAKFQIMGPEFRQARANFKNKMDKCWWCRKRFSDGDQTVIVCIKNKRNKLLCESCGQPLIDGGK